MGNDVNIFEVLRVVNEVEDEAVQTQVTVRGYGLRARRGLRASL